MSTRKSRSLAFVLAAAASSIAFIAPSPASAGLLVESAPDCDNGSTSQVFADYGDSSWYFKAPDGDLEAGGQGWSFSGGAAVEDGDSANLTGSGSKSVNVPFGGVATSSTVCVGLGEPTLRFMVKKSSGGLLSSMRVEVLVETSLGLVVPVPIGIVGGTSSWKPGPQTLVVANLLPLLPGNHTPVAFRFVSQGGSWQVDDLHIDPPRKP